MEYDSSIEEVVENMCKTVNDMDAFRDALKQLRFRLQGLLSCTSCGSEQFWISLFFAHSLSTKLQTRPATFAILSSFYPSPRPFARVFFTEVRLRCNSLPLHLLQVGSPVPLVGFFPARVPCFASRSVLMFPWFASFVSPYVSLAFSLFPLGR